MMYIVLINFLVLMANDCTCFIIDTSHVDAGLVFISLIHISSAIELRFSVCGR